MCGNEGGGCERVGNALAGTWPAHSSGELCWNSQHSMRNSTDRAAGGGGQEYRICRKANKNEFSRCTKMRMDFGGCFAYNDGAAHPGKLSEGEQHGQENLEEGEEDPTDQAADDDVQEVGPSSIGRSAPCNGARAPAGAHFSGERGRCPSGSGPFCVGCDFISARASPSCRPLRDRPEVIEIARVYVEIFNRR